MIVEDGSIVLNADSYCDLTFAAAFHTSRNNTAWADADKAAKEAALIKATQYVDAKYWNRWKGCLVNPYQALAWPRAWVAISDRPSTKSFETFDTGFGYLPNNSIPIAVKRAVCEGALRALSGSLLADYKSNVAEKTVDVITTKYFQGKESQTQYPEIEMHLRGLITNASSVEIYRS